MQNIFIKVILKLNRKFFFKKSHPFNLEKNGTLNLNYSDFEYNHTEGLLKTYYKALNLNEKDSFFSGKKILEIGCGGGGKSVYIAEKYNSELVGIDINDDFLSQAKKFAREKGVENNTCFYNKSATSNGFKDNEFDLIIMSDVIEHIPDSEKLFEESFRVLKKGGIIIFDFAPYYHYFGHHLWDTIQVPWLHLIFTDKFLIKLYKESVKDLPDGKNRVNLRVGKDNNNKEVFDYLNKISRKKFENMLIKFLSLNKVDSHSVDYHMLKSIGFFSFVPMLREVFIRHIIGYIKK